MPLTTLCISGHSLDLTALLFDVTTTCSGGVTARLGGKLDIAGTINAFFDADIPPYLTPPLIQPGVSGICLFGVSPTRAIQCPVIVEKLHFESAVDKAVTWNFDVKGNSRAGVFVYPPL